MSKLEVKVYPLDEPQGSTKAFASVNVDDLVAIRGVRVIEGDKGLFVSMPQSKDKNGEYHDLAFPLDGEMRKEVNKMVRDEYKRVEKLPPEQRVYEKPEANTEDINLADIRLDIKVFPLNDPDNSTKAFASVGVNDLVAISGIRVIEGDKGLFVSMPQSKDKDGVFHDIAFPLKGNLRKEINKAVLDKHNADRGSKKKSIEGRLQEGKQRSAQQPARKNFAPKSQSHSASL